MRLWDNGLEEVNGPEDRIVGKKLQWARKALSLPHKNELTRSAYWQRLLVLDDVEFEYLLSELNIVASPQKTKLPKGAIKKLKAHINKRTK